jgi:SAM-dependent methyltransferase
MDIGTFMRGNGNGTKNANGSKFEAAVLQRYAEASRKGEAGLCVPINYDRSLLEVILQEVIEKDYGCGDPSRYIHEGETVLDLGSGSGKACYIISQIAGAKGKVIGIDFNPPMLALAREYQKSIGDKLGYHNVEFRRAGPSDVPQSPECRLGRRDLCTVISIECLIFPCASPLIRRLVLIL